MSDMPDPPIQDKVNNLTRQIKSLRSQVRFIKGLYSVIGGSLAIVIAVGGAFGLFQQVEFRKAIQDVDERKQAFDPVINAAEAMAILNGRQALDRIVPQIDETMKGLSIQLTEPANAEAIEGFTRDFDLIKTGTDFKESSKIGLELEKLRSDTDRFVRFVNALRPVPRIQASFREGRKKPLNDFEQLLEQISFEDWKSDCNKTGNAAMILILDRWAAYKDNALGVTKYQRWYITDPTNRNERDLEGSAQCFKRATDKLIPYPRAWLNYAAVRDEQATAAMREIGKEVKLTPDRRARIRDLLMDAKEAYGNADGQLGPGRLRSRFFNNRAMLAIVWAQFAGTDQDESEARRRLMEAWTYLQNAEKQQGRTPSLWITKAQTVCLAIKFKMKPSDFPIPNCDKFTVEMVTDFIKNARMEGHTNYLNRTRDDFFASEPIFEELNAIDPLYKIKIFEALGL